MSKQWLQHVWELTPRFLTSRRLPLWLVWRRSLNSLKNLYRYTPFYRWTLPTQANLTVSASFRDLWPGDPQKGSEILAGTSSCGSLKIAYQNLWKNPTVPDYFWRDFHGFRWLRDIKAVDGQPAYSFSKQVISDWLHHYQHIKGIAWEPSVAAERLNEWINCLSWFSRENDPEFLAVFMLQIKRHWIHLKRCLPGNLFGYQLLRSIKTLLRGWLLLNEQLDTPRYFFRLFEEELSRQILHADGYIERCPSHQLYVLEDLIDLCAAFADNNQDVPLSWQESLTKLAAATFYLQQPDGGLPSFNGSTHEDPRLVRQILAATGLNPQELPAIQQAHMGGYCRLEANQTVLILDTGVLPPPPYDHDMHAGALSFELAVGFEPMIVNCGHHPASAWQDVQRSTAAHSTLVIADTNSCFLGKKGGVIKGPNSVQCQRQEENGNIWLEAVHDGYKKMFGAIHTRRLYLANHGFDLRGEDSVKSAGGHKLVVRFHLHPAVAVHIESAQQQAVLQLPSGQIWHLRTTTGDVIAEESVYLGKDGTLEKSQQLVITNLPTNPEITIKWALTKSV